MKLKYRIYYFVIKQIPFILLGICKYLYIINIHIPVACPFIRLLLFCGDFAEPVKRLK